jgi:predicted O-methyltransferase YrrM
MDIEHVVSTAEQIHGWMSKEELRWLAETAAERKLIVEVGSWRGRSTKALAMTTPGRVFAVDHWSGSVSERDSVHREAVELGADEIFRQFCANLAPEIRKGCLVPLRQDSTVAAATLLPVLVPPGADMIFIDAEHTFESVRRDIVSFLPLCANGAVLCGHDYGHEPVTRAVRETLGRFEVRVVAGSIWAVTV